MKNLKKFIQSLLFLSLINLFFISCEKDLVEKESKEEKYPIHYNFVNTTSNELRYLNFKVKTFFPIEWETNLKYKQFPKVKPYDTATLTVDTLGGIGHFGYSGCQTQMEINVYNDIDETYTYVSTWWTKLDTIKSKTDAEIYFKWPIDTLNCVKIDSYIVLSSLID